MNANDVKLDPSWKGLLKSDLTAPYFEELTAFVKHEYSSATCFPAGKDIFAAFEACPVRDTKVIILGQDPYHGPGQAHGLCFSVNDDMKHPPSLRNIFKEIESDIGKPIPQSGNLSLWANQGVLLLNATLTVRAHEAGSHQKKGWERFTDSAIKQLAMAEEHLVFILWGSFAQKKRSLIDEHKHLVLASPHPSPLSAHRGFFGNRHFSQANRYLESHGKEPIVW